MWPASTFFPLYYRHFLKALEAVLMRSVGSCIPSLPPPPSGHLKGWRRKIADVAYTARCSSVCYHINLDKKNSFRLEKKKKKQKKWARLLFLVLYAT